MKRSLEDSVGGALFILVVLLGMAALVAMIMVQWNTLNQKSRVLPASLLAVSTADYSGVRPTGQVHVVGMAIVGDMIRDLDGLQPGDLENRLASVTAEFLSPVPTATPIYPQNVVPSSTQLPTQENPPKPQATSTDVYHPTSTANTPVGSQTLPAVTATSVVPVPTMTPAPGTLPTYTSVPNPPTSQPPTSQPPTSQPPTAQPPPPQATNKPHPPHPTEKPHPPKPTKKPKK